MPPFLLLYIDFNPGYPVHQTVPADDIPIDALNLYVRTHIMGFATHLGPWLLGTVKNTTGTTAGTVQNMGATHSLQTKTVAYADTTAQTLLASLPAGSLIQQITFLTTTAYTTTAPTFIFYVNGTAINSATAPAGTTAGTTGRGGFTLGTANPSLVANVGSSDALVTFTQANGGGGTGAGTLEISYIVRGSNGAMYPSSTEQ